MYKELTNGSFFIQEIAYPSLMKKHIKKHSSFLQPMFEAISNSLEVTNGAEDCITIRLYFAKTLKSDKLDFLSLEISDTGKGFTEDNLSRLKCLFDESKGQNNLGTGRIQYLHFFYNTDIYSIFEEGGKKYKRRIVLSQKFYLPNRHSVIWIGDKLEIEEDTPTGTSVSFYYPIDEDDKIKYNELSPQVIKESIFIHYLSRFCLKKGNFQEFKFEQYINNVHDKSKDCFIKDSDIPKPDYEDSIKVNYSKMSADNDLVKLSKTENFEIKSFNLPVGIQKKNEVKLTSKNETVDVQGFDFSFMSEAPKIGNNYYLFLISSSYLTDKDTDVRGQLLLSSRKDFLKNRNLFTNQEEILVDDIQEQATTSIINHYEHFRKAKNNQDNKIDELAEMFSLDRNVLNKVGYRAGDSDQVILKRVYEYNADIEAKQDAGVKSIIDSLGELVPGSKDFSRKLNEKVKRVTELVPQINRTELAKYITKRKVVLDLMQKTIDKKLNCQQTGTKKRIDNERFLHNILFSQHSSNPLDSNLWMINDDYIHFQGTSETEFRNILINEKPFFREDLSKEEEEELTSFNRDRLGNRPDILLFPKEHKCIIVELKSIDADVSKFVSQVSQYAGLIRQYSKEEYEITSFYSYLIGENFTLNEVQRANPFLKKAYYFDYLFCPAYPVSGGDNRREGEMYIEVIKYSTLLERAISRNKIFTDKIKS